VLIDTPCPLASPPIIPAKAYRTLTAACGLSEENA
jgi:hypothetical protein